MPKRISKHLEEKLIANKLIALEMLKKQIFKMLIGSQINLTSRLMRFKMHRDLSLTATEVVQLSEELVELCRMHLNEVFRELYKLKEESYGEEHADFNIEENLGHD